jgi:hypothetical protein
LFDFEHLNIYENFKFFDLSSSKFRSIGNLNSSEKPNDIKAFNIHDVIDCDASEKFYISPVGCKGILRRKDERQIRINARLEYVLHEISSLWSKETIEELSRKQKRGRFSPPLVDAKRDFGSSQFLFE